MNTFAAVIVTNAKKAEAQKVISALYSTPATETEDAVVSTHGDNFFGIELKKDFRTFWASSGGFLTAELTALVDSGVPYYTFLGNDLTAALTACKLTRVLPSPDEE
tara:strand:- start:194 stop:511 length:318 start_codon:yes stop_codon:yes gene_type:complete